MYMSGGKDANVDQGEGGNIRKIDKQHRLRTDLG
jgi:hypothetical protein